MKIYTKTGDKGSTSLLGGDRVEKSDLRVWTYGSIDEANSSLGVARSIIKDNDINKILLQIQKTLFEVGAELASTGTVGYKPRIKEDDIKFLEENIDNLQKMQPVQTGFIIPGGTVESGYLDVARTDVRRAERYIAELKKDYTVDDRLLKYVNRLSDAIYVMARYFDFKDIIAKSKEKIENLNNYSPFKLNRKHSEYITQRCIEKSYEIGVPMVICIDDFNGNIIMLERMDDSLHVSIDIAIGKAYTSAVFRIPTGDLHDIAKPEGELYGIGAMKNVITFGGGYPLKVNDKVVGSIGVSGGTVSEDTEVASFGVEIFEEEIVNGN